MRLSAGLSVYMTYGSPMSLAAGSPLIQMVVAAARRPRVFGTVHWVDAGRLVFCP